MVSERDDAGGLAEAFRTDVFISYAREDRETAAQLADALAQRGLQVWWDRDLPAGIDFAKVIEAQLESARVVLALWSLDSVHSGFVRDESSRALRAGKLLPVRIVEVDLPLGFGQLHTLDLFDWDGDTDDEAFKQVLVEVQRIKGQRVTSTGETRPFGAWKFGRSALLGLLTLTIAILGYGGKVLWDKEAADSHFRAGLEHQHAKEPELVNALNAYLSALEYRPEHARARYYLAHVYVQNRQPADALDSFRLALAHAEAPLDKGQRAEAQKQLVLLASDPNEAPALSRSVASASTDAPTAGATASRSLSVPAPARASPSVSAAADAAAPAKPPRIDAPPAALAQLATLVEAMFDENKERRITATTSLIADPNALSDAVPLAVVKALATLRGGNAALTPSASSGIVNTLVLLQSALPGTLDVQRRPIEELIAATQSQGEYTRQQAAKVDASLRLAATRKPVSYLQIANEAQRPIAQALAARLRNFGYEAPAIELVGDRAPAATELRVQGKSDRGYARWIAKVVGELGEQAPQVTSLRSAQPNADTYEVWLGRDLCAPNGRQIPSCKTP